MNKYIQIFRLSFQTVLEYRANLIWRLLGIVVQTGILYLFWTAVLGTGFAGNKYSVSSLGIYYLAITFVSMFVEFSYKDFSEDIREGFLAVHLIKPYNYFAYVFLGGLPEKLLSTTLVIVIMCILIMLGIQFNLHLDSIAIGLLFMVGATLLNFLFALVVGGLSFWFRRVHGFNALFFNFGSIFSGELIPFDLLPKALQQIGDLLPFKYVYYVPAKLLTSDYNNEILTALAIQFIWIVIFFILAKFIWKKGIRKFEATGR